MLALEHFSGLIRPCHVAWAGEQGMGQGCKGVHRAGFHSRRYAGHRNGAKLTQNKILWLVRLVLAAVSRGKLGTGFLAHNAATGVFERLQT